MSVPIECAHKSAPYPCFDVCAQFHDTTLTVEITFELPSAEWGVRSERIAMKPRGVCSIAKELELAEIKSAFAGMKKRLIWDD